MSNEMKNDLLGKKINVRFMWDSKDYNARDMCLLDVDPSGWVKLERENGDLVWYPPTAIKRIKEEMDGI